MSYTNKNSLARITSKAAEMTLKYLILFFIFTKYCSACPKWFNFTKSTAEVDKKLPGIWNDLTSTRIIEACDCGTNNIQTDPPWLLFINLKPGVELNTEGMTGCVGTIITSNLIATSYNCIHRKSSRQPNIFDLWNITTKIKSQPSSSTVTCNPDPQNPSVPCQIIQFTKDPLDVPPILTKDDLIVSSKPFGEGKQFEVLEIIFQEPYWFHQFWKLATEADNKKLKENQEELKKVKVIENDILLLKLYADFTTNPNFNPICIPDHHEINFLNQLGEYYGAGMGMHPSSKSVDVNAGIVLWNGACDIYDQSNKIELNENKTDQISPLCMVWSGGWYELGQILGGGPLVIESESSPPISFLAGVMNSLGANNIGVIASFTNILPVLKYLMYRAYQHKSKWCRTPTALKLAPPIITIANGTYRPWISASSCNKEGRISPITMFRTNSKSRSGYDNEFNEVEGPDVKIEFLTEDDKIVESYYAEKLCDCTPILNPRGLVIAKLKANGVCLRLFIDEGKCSTYNNFNEILQVNSKDLVPPEKLVKVKSFQLCQPFLSCFNVSVTFFRISINDNQFTQALSSSKLETLVVPAFQKANLGKDEIKFTTEFKFPHSLEIETIKGFTAIQTSGIEIDIEKDGDARRQLPVDFLKRSFIAAYDTRMHNDTRTVKFASDEYTGNCHISCGLSVSSTVFPCFNVTATLETSYARNVNLEYEAYVKIIGLTECNTPLHYDSLYEFIPEGFSLKRERGSSFELVAATKAKLILSFSVGPPQSKNTIERIPNC